MMQIEYAVGIDTSRLDGVLINVPLSNTNANGIYTETIWNWDADAPTHRIPIRIKIVLA